MNFAISDHYQQLGLSPDASLEAIRKRHRDLARRYHPDMDRSAEAAEKIRSINEAYHTLSDLERRSAYPLGINGSGRAEIRVKSMRTNNGHAQPRSLGCRVPALSRRSLDVGLMPAFLFGSLGVGIALAMIGWSRLPGKSQRTANARSIPLSPNVCIQPG